MIPTASSYADALGVEPWTSTQRWCAHSPQRPNRSSWQSPSEEAGNDHLDAQHSMCVAVGSLHVCVSAL